MKYLLIIIILLNSITVKGQVSVSELLENKGTIGYPIYNPNDLDSLYIANTYNLAWLGCPNYADVLQAYYNTILKASAHGLSPHEYHLQHLIQIGDKIRSREDAGMLAIADILISDGLIRYGTHLYKGRFNKPGINPYYYTAKKDKDIPAILVQAIRQQRGFEPYIDELSCKQPQYRILQKEMIKISETSPDWELVPMNYKYNPGDTGRYTKLLNEKLRLMGYLEYTDEEIAFDRKTEDAILHFQEDHGLNRTGLPDNDTKALLNISPKGRIDRIKLALERWRWMPDTEPDNLILVNIPSYSVHYIKTGKEILSSKVIVGKNDRQTPLFTADLKSVVINPYWHVPKSIAEEELLPKIKENPGYLKAHNMVLYRNGIGLSNDELSISGEDLDSYSIKQLPGPTNSLGKIKFLFPNNNNVYLHDTPEKKLFSRNIRTFSHGCIRMEEPEKLAALLIADTLKLQEAMKENEEVVFRVTKKIPVYILYFTAWVNNQKVLYYQDVYGRDSELLKSFRSIQSGSADKITNRWYLSAGN